MKKPILIATLGFPGSGKTYFSRKLAKQFGMFHLNSDRLRLEMISNPNYTQEEHKKVFNVMDFIAEELLAQRISVIYDANSTKRAYRKRLEQISRKAGANYLLIHFVTPVETALGRIKERVNIKSKTLRKYHRPVTPEVLFRLKKQAEPPKGERYVEIKGTIPYSEQVRIVSKHLK